MLALSLKSQKDFLEKIPPCKSLIQQANRAPISIHFHAASLGAIVLYNSNLLPNASPRTHGADLPWSHLDSSYLVSTDRHLVHSVCLSDILLRIFLHPNSKLLCQNEALSRIRPYTLPRYSKCMCLSLKVCPYCNSLCIYPHSRKISNRGRAWSHLLFRPYILTKSSRSVLDHLADSNASLLYTLNQAVRRCRSHV